MALTIIWYTFFWLYMFSSIILFIPLLILDLFKIRSWRDNYAYYLTSSWSRNLIRASGTKVTVKGLEHLPGQNNICFIANHQGGFDIPLMMGHLGKPISFIAKKELMLIPVMGGWMKAIRCIFIDRSDRRKSVTAINKGAAQIKQGHPMVIFPEGTRSRSQKMRDFKSGSLKLAIKANALIVPITIDGSYKIKEANKGLIKPADVKLTIHPAVDVSELDSDEKKDLAQKLQKTVQSGLG